LMMSRCPNVMGSKDPGNKAFFMTLLYGDVQR
jgi:hypothetical protein